MNKICKDIVDESVCRLSSHHQISKGSSFSEIKAQAKKRIVPGQFIHKFTTISELENFEESIGDITSKFLSNHPNTTKVMNFKSKYYKQDFQGNYIEIILLIKHFPEFNLMDYISASPLTHYTKTETRKLNQARNNIILSILTIAKECQILEKNNLLSRDNIYLYTSPKQNILKHQERNMALLSFDNKDISKSGSDFNLNKSHDSNEHENGDNNYEPIFGDLSFLNNLLDELKLLIIEEGSALMTFNINSKSLPGCATPRVGKSKIKDTTKMSEFDYDVEIFFLSLLEYKNDARVIGQKFSQAFRDYIAGLNIQNKITLETLITRTTEKENYNDYTESEIVLIRKILSNSAIRKFYYGFEFLLKINPFNIFMSEGRIWKNIGMYMNKEQVYVLWTIYENNIVSVRHAQLKTTIEIEHNSKITNIKKNIYLLKSKNNKDSKLKKKLKLKVNELEKEKNLFFVTCLKELIVIFFQYDLKELVMYFFEQYESRRKEPKVPLDIYEICLDYDEDISIDIMNRALTPMNTKEEHMKMVLLKKYFRLARELLKFKVCKMYLDSPPPETDNYLWLMYKNQIKKKNEEFTRVVLNRDQKNEGDQLISLLHEDSKKSESAYQHNSLSNSKLSYNAFAHTSAIIRNSSNKHNNITNMNNYNSNNNNNNSSTNSQNNSCLLTKDVDDSNQNLISIQQAYHRDSKLRKPSSTYISFGGFKLKTPQSNNVSKYDVVSIKKESNKNNNNISNSANSNNNNNNTNQIGISFTKNSSNYFNNNTTSDNKQRTPTVEESFLFKSLKLPTKQQNMDTNDSSYQKSVLKPINKSKTIDDINFSQLAKIVPRINVQQILIEYLRFGEYIFDCLCLLSSIQPNKIILDYADKTCQYLWVFTTSEDSITRCPYPLISIALAAEYLTRIGYLNKKVQYRANSVITELLKLGESIQSSMKNEDMLNYYLKGQTDHIGRSALEIYAENGFSILLNNVSVGGIVGKMWYGTGHEQSMFEFFRLTRILKCSIVYENYEIVVSKNYLPKEATYVFQFHHFIQNCSARFNTNSMMSICSTVLFELEIYLYVEDTKKINRKFYQPPLSTLSFVVSATGFLNLLNSLWMLVYYYKTGRRLKVDKWESITDFVLFVSILLNLIQLGNEVSDDDEDTNMLFTGVIYAVLITASWMRVIMILLKTYHFGSFFRITFEILWHVAAFLLITFCFMFLFAQVFTVFFQNTNDDFFEIYSGFITLFNSAFGQINFEGFNELSFFGYIAIMLFTAVSNVILFNLIVGIINNLFNELQEKADAENRSVLILAHERIKWDDRFGLLILLPAPLNVFSIVPIIALLIYSHNREHSQIQKLNLIFSKVAYFFIALFYFLFLFIVGLIALPFAYFKSMVHSIYDLYSNTSRRSICTRLLSLTFRLFSLIWFFCEDLAMFWQLVYQKNKCYSEKNQKRTLSRQYILALIKILGKFKYKEKKKNISINDLYSKLGLVNFRRRKKNDQALTISSSKNKNDETTSVSSHIFQNQQLQTPPNNVVTSNTSSSPSGDKINSRNNSVTVNNTNNTNNNNIVSSSNNNNITHTKSGKTGTGTGNDSLLSMTSFSNNDRYYAKERMKYFIDKLVDIDGFIDVDRTLLILPFRVKYSDEYMMNLHHFNVRVLIRGVRKYFFKTEVRNQAFNYKKLELMINKLYIKAMFIYHHLPSEYIKTLRASFHGINTDPDYERYIQVLQGYEEKDDASEYDDEGQFYSPVLSDAG